MIDNYDLFEMHEAALERKAKKFPVCCACCEPILEDRKWHFPDDNDYYHYDCFMDYVMENCWSDNDEEGGW